MGEPTKTATEPVRFRLTKDVAVDSCLFLMKKAKVFLYEANNPDNNLSGFLTALENQIVDYERRVGGTVASLQFHCATHPATLRHVVDISGLRAYVDELIAHINREEEAKKAAATAPAPAAKPERVVHVPDFYKPWSITDKEYAWYGVYSTFGTQYRLPYHALTRLKCDRREPPKGYRDNPLKGYYCYLGDDARARAVQALKDAYAAYDDFLTDSGYDRRGAGPTFDSAGRRLERCECAWYSRVSGDKCPTHDTPGVPVSTPVPEEKPA